MGAITGAIAGAYYNKMPYALYNFGMEKLPKDIQNIVGLFNSEHGHSVSCRWRNAEFDTEELIRKVNFVKYSFKTRWTNIIWKDQYSV